MKLVDDDDDDDLEDLQFVLVFLPQCPRI